MKLPCEMMEDLLPLYVEDMATNATRAAVEEHLSDCEPCRDKLADLRAEKPENGVVIPLEPVRREIRKRLWHAVVAAVCAVTVVMLTLFAWDTVMTYIPYSEDMVGIETLPDGSQELHLYGPNGTSGWSLDGALYLSAVGPRNQRGSGECIMPLGMERAVYYIDITRHGVTTLIWGEPQDGDAAQILPRLALNYYMLIAVAAAAVLLGVGYRLRARKIGRVAKHLGVLALCYAVAHFLVMGTNGMSFEMAWDFGLIAVITLLLWGLATSGEQLIRQMRRDRA